LFNIVESFQPQFEGLTDARQLPELAFLGTHFRFHQILGSWNVKADNEKTPQGRDATPHAESFAKQVALETNFSAGFIIFLGFEEQNFPPVNLFYDNLISGLDSCFLHSFICPVSV
jgi:hypothetical protein